MYPDSSQNLSYETDEAIYWFTHAFDPLNNWSSHMVRVWGKRFNTVEHAYHYRKFYETAPKVATEIFRAPSPWAAWQIARKYKTKIRADWDDVKVSAMINIVRAKAEQNEDVRDCLFATGKKAIVENSPWDNFWGCGPNKDGQNMMGKILMQIRDELRTSVRH